MARPIKIGVVCPYSTIYPSLSRDFLDGIGCGISTKLRGEFQLVPEFIKQGEPSAVKSALEKLISFDNVDFISGLVGYRTISEFVPFIEKNRKVCLFADMGEYIPFTGFTSDYLFFNSFQYWQAEYALGNWSQRTYPGRGVVFMPVYDSGYHMHSAFRQGAILAQNEVMEYSVIRFSTGIDYSVTGAMLEYMQKFRKEKPAFIHALFSGDDATEFYSVFHREGLHKEIPLVVSPHMASIEILRQISHLDMSFHTASMWNYDADDEPNKLFKSRYITETGDAPNIFSLLGYEIGMMFEALYPSVRNNDIDKTRKLLKEERLLTPRGERNFYLDSEYALPTIDIEKVRIQNNKAVKMVVGQGKSLAYNNYIFDEIHRENVSGWLNPYLCV